jgi:hypothetical protein
MPERAAEPGGECTITARVGGGTCVSVWLLPPGGPEAN